MISNIFKNMSFLAHSARGALRIVIYTNLIPQKSLKDFLHASCYLLSRLISMIRGTVMISCIVGLIAKYRVISNVTTAVARDCNTYLITNPQTFFPNHVDRIPVKCLFAPSELKGTGKFIGKPVRDSEALC